MHRTDDIAWEPTNEQTEHAYAGAVVDALARDAIPEVERGYYLALVANHVAMCGICTKAATADKGEHAAGEEPSE